MKSIWQEAAWLPRPPLQGNITADAAVIGGGMAGILTAYFLQQMGKRVVVLESNTIGSGQTGGTSAKITAQHGLRYHQLIATQGEQKARQYAQGNLWAVKQYKQLILEKKIACHYEEATANLYSCQDTQALWEEYRAAKHLGMDVQMAEENTLPFAVSGVLRLFEQGHFHPLQFLHRMAESLTVYEQSRVIQVVGQTAYTQAGQVEAEDIVFASHFPVADIPGYFPLRQHRERSYVVALRGAARMDGMYFGIDQGGLSFRNYGELLLLGGSGHRTGDSKKRGQYEHLHAAAAAFWQNSHVVSQWSAQDCIPLDGIPYIGKFSWRKPHWYVLTGFQKWGMSTAMLGASMVADEICKRKNPYRAVFSPQRFTPLASAKEAAQNTGKTVNSIFLQKIRGAEQQLATLQRGEGGLVRREGCTVGAYRDENDEIFLVAPNCPHFGCRLAWNKAEKSWDCPCHGSRFDYRGNLLDNPAKEGLTHESVSRLQ